jgi:3-vinyl bacteriochlorophyllide hydratase
MDQPRQARGPKRAPLYSPEERRRRDATAWTLVQGVLAPVQFAGVRRQPVLVLRYLATGEGLLAASVSVLAKTALLYTDHDHRLRLGEGGLRPLPVRARLLLGRRGVSMVVLTLHTAYLAAWPPADDAAGPDAAGPGGLCTSYVINAVQFLLKLRMARLDERLRRRRRCCASAASARCSAA